MPEKIEKNYLDLLSSNVAAIDSLAATVRGTVGPKGFDVMLIDQYGDYSSTNDGVEILSKIEISHPAAKLAVEVAKAQEKKVGDGTTTATIVTDSLLKEALLRVKSGISPNKLVKGINLAINELCKTFEKESKKIKDINDEKLLAITTISARGDLELSSLLIDAIGRLSEIPEALDFSSLIKAEDAGKSRILDGLFIKKKTHFNYNKDFKNAPALFIEGAFEPKAIPAEAVTTDEGVKKFTTNLDLLEETAKKIVKAGIKAIFVDASMFSAIEEYFVKEGVFVLTRVKKEDLKSLSLMSGTKMVNREDLFSADLNKLKDFTGTLKSILFDDELKGLIIEGSKFYLPTVLVSAETPLLLMEKERIAIDAAKAMQKSLRSGYVLGEGLAEINAKDSLKQLDVSSDEKDGVEIVIKSLEALFRQIVSNAGYDPEEMLSKVKGSKGIDFETGGIIDLEEAGILDPLEVKTNAYKIAAEIACQILKINMIIQAKNV